MTYISVKTGLLAPSKGFVFAHFGPRNGKGTHADNEGQIRFCLCSFDLDLHCLLTVQSFNIIFTLSIMANVNLFKVRKSMVRSEVIPIFRVNTVDTSIEYIREPMRLLVSQTVWQMLEKHCWVQPMKAPGTRRTYKIPQCTA